MIKLRSLLRPNANGKIEITHLDAARTLEVLQRRAAHVTALAKRVPNVTQPSKHLKYGS